jgi:hypothetical protein
MSEYTPKGPPPPPFDNWGEFWADYTRRSADPRLADGIYDEPRREPEPPAQPPPGNFSWHEYLQRWVASARECGLFADPGRSPPLRLGAPYPPWAVTTDQRRWWQRGVLLAELVSMFGPQLLPALLELLRGPVADLVRSIMAEELPGALDALDAENGGRRD